MAPEPASPEPVVLPVPSQSEQQPRPPPPPPSEKRPSPSPWSDTETVHLIDAYQEKWFSVNRGPLKSSQWDEIAASVSARRGGAAPTRTGTQCRHKLEKLRKRYRTEKQLTVPSPWPYFHRMDLLARGPLPISAAHPMIDGPDDPDSDDDDDEDEDVSNTRSVDYILRTAASGDRTSRPGVLVNSMVQKRRRLDGGGSATPMGRLASVVRSFGEGFVRVERERLEMMREAEKDRMAMETEKTRMILDSFRQIGDALTFGLAKRG
ncbi:hypothetical protein QJS10_CPA06g01993 [Acorus calamus]|uniref:Myb-like domain-containing protein n=1 Tax=Acorus calamus TaxID=4465 RepID=A0AAV9EPB9_ACOCL|nr:hypothetical protein QJS10_CPA06g01993 [Acorus calamus]